MGPAATCCTANSQSVVGGEGDGPGCGVTAGGEGLGCCGVTAGGDGLGVGANGLSPPPPLPLPPLGLGGGGEGDFIANGLSGVSTGREGGRMTGSPWQGPPAQCPCLQ